MFRDCCSSGFFLFCLRRHKQRKRRQRKHAFQSKNLDFYLLNQVDACSSLSSHFIQVGLLGNKVTDVGNVNSHFVGVAWKSETGGSAWKGPAGPPGTARPSRGHGAGTHGQPFLVPPASPPTPRDVTVATFPTAHWMRRLFPE